MVRPLRILYGDATYHITSRGNGGQDIFLDEEDREKFKGLLSRTVVRFEFIIYAYCLMGNHYHLVMSTPRANLPDGMHYLNGVYAQGFNHRHRCKGHLFQERYCSRLIENEAYLAEAARYTLLNPVRAGLTENIADWMWSSYRATSGLDPTPPFLKESRLLSLFGGDMSDARGLFMEFVAEGVGKESPFSGNEEGIIPGGKAGVKTLEAAKTTPAVTSREVPSRQRNLGRPSLEEIFLESEREEGAYQAVFEYGYRLREVGEFLGVHYSVVSRIVKRIEQSVR